MRDTEEGSKDVDMDAATSTISIPTSLVVTSTVVLSLVSFVATRAGLLSYFQEPMATGLALGVQLGLLGLAWEVPSGKSRTLAIYVVVMCFSVTFSFVFFQSQLAAPLRANANQRALTDTIDATARRLSETTSNAQRTNAEVSQRLAVWLRLEDSVGFSTRACVNEEIGYLNLICARLRQRVSAWEQSTGHPYREGPGQRVMYGSLLAEADVVRQDSVALAQFAKELITKFGAHDQGSNGTRLRNYSATVGLFPRSLITRYLPNNDFAPPVLSLQQYDELQDPRESQWQSFDDLAQAFRGTRESARLGHATIFAAALAFAVDLIVLAVALGVESRQPTLKKLPATFPGAAILADSWDGEILKRVRGWTRAAFIEADPSLEKEETVIGEVLERSERSESGEDLVVVTDRQGRRFLNAIARSGLARFVSSSRHNRKESFVYVMQPCVHESLVRYLVLRSDPQPFNPTQNVHF